MSEETKRALLARAANRLGVLPLAKEMKVPDGLLAAWISGHASMPDRMLVRLADILEKLGDEPKN
jgi:hypothetical protein